MDNKLIELVQAASNRTARGGLVWTAFGDDSFRVAVGAGHLFIRRGWTRLHTDDDERYAATVYTVQVTDGQGRTVSDWEATEGETGYTSLDQLFQAARNAALKSDRVIEDMLQALQAGA